MKNKFLGKYRLGSKRLQDWDYSQTGYYFITICSYNRKNIFGKIENGKMILNEVGKIVEEEWLKTEKIRSNVKLDKFVIMPNHLHGILIIGDTENVETPQLRNIEKVETPRRGVSTATRKLQLPANSNHNPEWKSNSVGAIINQFKGICTKRIRAIYPSFKHIWQSRFHDRIIRDEEEFNCIQAYILTNAENWESDEENLKQQF